jgi:hypothetical protein
MKDSHKIRVCSLKLCQNYRIENPKGFVYNLDSCTIHNIEQNLSGNKDWIMVDHNYPSNLILTSKEHFDHQVIRTYFKTCKDNPVKRFYWPKKTKNIIDINL